MARPRLTRWLALWLTLALFGCAPAALLLLLRDPPAPPWPTLHAEANGRAQALDARIQRWFARTEVLAQEVSSLLAQLPEGPIGTAAEGTLMLHLQRRLASDGEMGEYSVLTSSGEVILSTDGTRVGQPAGRAFPEVAQAARRPTAALVAAAVRTTHLVVGAPVTVGARLRGIFTARLRTEASRELLRPSLSHLEVDLVDGSGQSLSGRAGDGDRLELGSESRPGRRWLGGRRPVVFVPLRQVRAVVTVEGPPVAAAPRVGRWHALAGAAILTLAGAAAWLFCRRPRCPDPSSG